MYNKLIATNAGGLLNKILSDFRYWLSLTVLSVLLCSTSNADEKDSGADLLSGAAWERFAERVKAMGAIVQQDSVPKTELEVAEGYRFLLAQLAEEIQVALYRSDLGDPLLRRATTKFSSLAMPSSDGNYLSAQIADDGVYRLWGKMGTASGNKSFQFYALMNAQDSWNLQDFIDADNNFDIQLGGKQPAKAVDGQKNWVPIPSGATLLNLREYFSDWNTESPSSFFLDRLDRPERVATLTPKKMAALLEEVNQRSETLIPFFMQSLVQHREKLQNRVLPAGALSDVGLKDNIYGPGWFNLRDDEAMVLVIDPSKAYYWSVQLGNFWGEALDFVNFTSSITDAQAYQARDGKYWLVIAKHNPGVANWIDTAGHNEGMVFTRFQGIAKSPPQVVRIVPLEELTALLPKDTPSITAEQHQARLRQRQQHMVKRWAP